MKKIQLLGALAIAAVLSACGQPEQPTRAVAAPPSGLTLATQGIDTGATFRTAAYAVQDVTVIVPSSLRSSEANVYYPLADIVWRGEPLGNRHEQVRALVTAAAEQATANMVTGPAANVEITIMRFHAVTEKTRYSVGGTHSVTYNLVVRDAVSGEILDGPREVIANTPAVGGVRALAEDAAGRTQKVVITERLIASFRAELSRPVSNAVAQAMMNPAVVGPVVAAN